MKKIGIILDSFSGLSKDEYQKMGFEYINQIMILDGKEYRDGIDGTFKDLQDVIYSAKDVKSSMPPIGQVVEKFEECSKKYENTIFLPMNKGMSSTYSTSVAASGDFKNITVLANNFSGHAYVYYGLKAMEMGEQGKSLEEIIKYLEDMSKLSETYVIPHSLELIIKSGRLSGMKKFILEKGKLIPRIYLTYDGLITRGVKRTFTKAYTSAVDKIIETIGSENVNDFIWEVIHTFEMKTAHDAEKYIMNKGIKKVDLIPASAATGAFNTKGSIGLNVYKK